MKISNILTGLFGVIFLSGAGPLFAQDTPDDVAVWATVERQWEANENGDAKWIDSILSEDFTGWSNDSPAPRTRESVRMWHPFESRQWEGEVHELYPLSIVVHGDTAVAHYLYSNAGKNAKGETEVLHGRYTDVLIRTDEGWKFITWHGGADDKD